MLLWVFHRESPWGEGRFEAQSLVFNLVQSWYPTLVVRDGTIEVSLLVHLQSEQY